MRASAWASAESAASLAAVVSDSVETELRSRRLMARKAMAMTRVTERRMRVTTRATPDLRFTIYDLREVFRFKVEGFSGRTDRARLEIAKLSTFVPPADLEIGGTAGLETCATFLQLRLWKSMFIDRL